MGTLPARLVNQTLESNTYVMDDGAGGCLVVDPGVDPSPLLQLLAARELTPRAVLCTHGHFDHVGGAARLQAVYDVPVHLHRDDEKTVRSANFMMMAFKLAARITLPQFTWVEEGAVVRAGALQARYQAAPGHTPGSCLIHVGGVVFTGDTIYARGVGLVELPGESPARLRQSILAVWDTLDEWLEILPGHGPSSAFGDLKRENLPLRRFLELPAAAGEDRS